MECISGGFFVAGYDLGFGSKKRGGGASPLESVTLVWIAFVDLPAGHRGVRCLAAFVLSCPLCSDGEIFRFAWQKTVLHLGLVTENCAA